MSDLEQRVHDAIARFRDLPREQQEVMRRAQRKSWVIGEMMLEHPEMTRAEAERLFNLLLSDKAIFAGWVAFSP